MLDRRLLTHFDWFFLLLILFVATIGILNLYSVTFTWKASAQPVYIKQILWFCLGTGIALGFCVFDYRKLKRLGWPLYFFTLGLLGWVLLFGKTSMGATRWIDLGFFNFQPSEVMKIALILVLACYFNERSHPFGCSLRDLIVPFLLLLTPFALVIKQPDLGTGLLILFVGLTVLLFIRIRFKTLLFLTACGVLAPVFGWFFLKDYQKARIYSFLDPERDPLGAGYHIIQSKIAVGSGGFWGKGFLHGTQSQLSFLPERHTDFAFSVFAEEWGFAGCAALLLVYFIIVAWGIFIAYRAADRFGKLLAVGVVCMFFWHVVVNLGMVIGLLPVVGVPLPFFSYGGTSMVTTMTGVGLLLNVSMRRFLF
jgi:rod shape determining protein RodA